MDRHPMISAFVLALGGIFAGPASQATAAQGATLAAASPVANFSGPIDIGGRKLYLECRGQGSPTVILEAGANGRADVWSRDNLHPAGARTMVLPGVAAFTRVCAYDRPGTIGEVNPDLDPHGPPFFPSRSDPVPQPRSTRDKVADLHALLRAADIRGPYVLVAHSAGGLVVRLYASMYPDEVVGMVLLDSTHEDVWLRFKEALPPAQWSEFEARTVTNQELLDAYPEAERWYYRPVGGRRQHRSGTPGESECAAAPDAARRSGPRHPLCRAVSGLAKRQDGRDPDRAAGGSRQARPQRALRHRYQERAQHPPGPARAGHRGDQGGGGGGAQPKHLDPSTVIPVADGISPFWTIGYGPSEP